MITVEGLQKTYYSAKNTEVVFDDFAITFAHKRNCLVGKNGTGKSTLLLMLAGLIEPEKGMIKCSDKQSEMQNLSLVQRREKIAIASDSLVFPPFLSAHEILQTNAAVWGLSWPEQLISQFNFTDHINKAVADLSAGNARKLQLIYALMRQTPILLLDEPNLALDPESLNTLFSAIELFDGIIICASNEPNLFTQKGFNLLSLKPSQGK